jgi:hypothetical protein
MYRTHGERVTVANTKSTVGLRRLLKRRSSAESPGKQRSQPPAVRSRHAGPSAGDEEEEELRKALGFLPAASQVAGGDEAESVAGSTVDYGESPVCEDGAVVDLLTEEEGEAAAGGEPPPPALGGRGLSYFDSHLGARVQLDESGNVQCLEVVKQPATPAAKGKGTAKAKARVRGTSDPPRKLGRRLSWKQAQPEATTPGAAAGSEGAEATEGSRDPADLPTCFRRPAGATGEGNWTVTEPSGLEACRVEVQATKGAFYAKNVPDSRMALVAEEGLTRDAKLAARISWMKNGGAGRAAEVARKVAGWPPP